MVLGVNGTGRRCGKEGAMGPGRGRLGGLALPWPDPLDNTSQCRLVSATW